MGIQDREYWGQWHKEREQGTKVKPPEPELDNLPIQPPRMQWHWSLRLIHAFAWFTAGVALCKLLA